MTFAPLVLGGEEQIAAIDLSGTPLSGSSQVMLDVASMSQATVRETTTNREDLLATFFLMTPDPNLLGNSAILLLESDPKAQQLYDLASAIVSRLNWLTYDQDLSDGSGLAVLSPHAINDGADGSRPGFRYVNPGRFEAVVIDTKAWSRYPGEEWDVREPNQMIPPGE